MSTTVSSNAAQEIALYKSRLDELYQLIETAAVSIDPGTKVGRTNVQIDEQLTGAYTVRSLEVSIPGKPGIRLVPKGIYNIGARGRVDARSRLSTQTLVWVEAGGPMLQRDVLENGNEIESATQPLFAGVPQGWAWTDDRRVELVPLTERTFIDRVLPELVA